ncbi:MAG: electron transfer flavoprotein subunit beta/FixA family protein [Balneolaceae bacterium]
MKIYVCIKQVPDIDAPIRIRDGRLLLDRDRMVMNAYDASALEAALVLTEETEGDVEAVLIGPGKAGETIRKALAMGADSGTHIVADTTGYDSAAYANILSAFFTGKTYNYIACGKQAQDTDSGLTGGMVARLLNIPYVSNAVRVEGGHDGITVTRQGDTGRELIDLPVPGLFTCSNDMNEPRIPGLKGIMQSKRKPVHVLSLDDLGIDKSSIKTHTRITGYEQIPGRKPGRTFEGEPGEIARDVAALLNEETGIS